MRKSELLVSLVVHNDVSHLDACLERLRQQTIPVRVKLLDNASNDGTLERSRRHPVQVISSKRNLGYSAGHNENLRQESFDFALLMNADVYLEADFLERLVERLEQFEEAGSAGGKLARMDRSGQPVRTAQGPLLDSTGIFFTPALRHFDRGSNLEDVGQFELRERVFGISGAALLIRRRFYEDVQVFGQFLDEDFFAYREDADLAWRGRLLGWEALYEPQARALHCRQVLPTNRKNVDPAINFHSVKNRYLMRIKNIDRAVRKKCFPYMWLRDLGILFYVVAIERESLKALSAVRRLKPRMHLKRLEIQGRRRVGPEALAGWFSFKPVSLPIETRKEIGQGTISP